MGTTGSAGSPPSDGNAEYRQRFADRVYSYFHNDGLLTDDRVIEQVDYRADQIDTAIIAESARWGDRKTHPPKDRDDWLTDVEEIRNWVTNWHGTGRSRTEEVISQLDAVGWWPDTAGATFHINGAPQHGGPIVQGDALTITAPAGTLYYTLDGTDPRQVGGALDPAAQEYGGPIVLQQSTHVKCRARVGGQWSPLVEATFYIDLAPHLRVTEIMYHPADPTPEEVAAGFTDAGQFEFIEIQNLSSTESLPLEGLRFSDGIDFTFPDLSLDPDGYAVVVRDQAAFEFRYGAGTATVAGTYTGALENAGERIVLTAPVGGVIQSFSYRDGWYGQTDGEGFSLTIRDPLGDRSLWDVKEGWRASEPPGGTPGSDDAALGPVAPDSIVIHEVLAHSDAPFVDAIELYNASDQPVDVSGWFLSDSAADLTAYEIPAVAPIAAGGYLLLDEDTHFGSAFALSESGDDVYLSSNAGGVAGGYREHVDFGASPRNIPFGLHTNSAGRSDFTLLAAPTLGAANAGPYLEDLVIHEIMYHPGDLTPDEVAAGYDRDDFEFIEIHNISSTDSYALADLYLGDGIGFSFGWYDADAAGNESWTLEPGASATWSAALPAGAAAYEVFARWDLLDPRGRARDLDGQARYRITHDGGTTEVIRDQKPELDDEGPDYMDEDGWVSLGSYTFDGSGAVELVRGTNNPRNWTIADQVKFVRQSDQHQVEVDAPALDSWYTSQGAAAVGTMLEAGGFVVVVSDLEAFDARYDIAATGIPVAGRYTGNLANNGEKVKLFRAGDAEQSGLIPYYRIDYVNYDDDPPWPTEPDGAGSALNRLSPPGYGSEPTAWRSSAAGGTPGAANVDLDTTPPSIPTGLASQVSIDPDSISLSWDAAEDAESYVDFYIVYRDDELLGTSQTTTFEDAEVQRGTFYSYRVASVNRDGYTSQPGAALEVSIPGIVNYGVPDANHVEITFSEAMDPATAEVEANYAFSAGAISEAALGPDGLTVSLTTVEELIRGNPYAVTIHNLTTLSGNPVPDPLELAFVYEPQGAGYIVREYWTGIGGSDISNLTSNPAYPDDPTGSAQITSLEGPVNWNNSYGTRIEGYIHPPETGAYTFWIAGDDNSELYLSTDADPANKVLIASVPGWSSSRQWNKYSQQQSSSISLVAGRKYYIEVLHKEGSGGDNIAVRWQLPDGQWEDPGNTNLPIPGVRLSPYVADTEPPTVDVVDVQPDPREEPVGQVHLLFSEPVTGFDLADLSLVRDGGANLLSGAESLDSANGFYWTLSGLEALTSEAGEYTLTLHAAGAGIQDDVGNPLGADAADTWTMIVPGPQADVIDVTPDPRQTAVDAIDIEFTVPVTGFDLADLSLVRDGGANLLSGDQTLTTGDQITWTLGGLADLTGIDGTYTLSLPAAGSGIEDGEGRAMTFDASDTWVKDTVLPRVQLAEVQPDPRTTAVDAIDLVFTEPVAGLDLVDLSLTRDGGPSLLSGDQTLTTGDQITWTLGGLAELTGGGGGATGFVTYNDHIPGAGTHANTTTYSAQPDQTASGLLQDVGSGQDTGVTLTVSDTGNLHYAGSQGVPAPGTDAHALFNGYVEFGSATYASIELRGADHRHTYTFDGLDTGQGATYKFHGAAIRGEPDYHDRWTLVTLVGAESFTPDHSAGLGVVTHQDQPGDVAENQIAIWTGDNSTADQGFVAGWVDIDPGSDGQFQVLSDQYFGPTPGVGDGTAGNEGSKGYGLTGIRLEEVPAAGIPGQYALSVGSDGSGIEDAAGNPLVVDTVELWTIGDPAPDSEPPLAVVYVAPEDFTNVPVSVATIALSEPVTGLDPDDLVLTRDGGPNLLDGRQSLSLLSAQIWQLGGLEALTAEEGQYTLNLAAAGSGVADALGNALESDAAISWTMDTQPPAADILDVEPDPRDTAVDALEIVFTEPVDGLELADLSLARDGGANLLTGSETLATSDQVTWTLSGLAPQTGLPGQYELALAADGSGIEDRAGNPLQADASESWTVVPSATVEGRWVFYNHSSFDGGTPGADPQDDGAIDAGKTALRPDEPTPVADFENVTSYARGLNGVMIDLAGLPAAELQANGDPGTSDFEFRVGNSADPAGWQSSFDGENPAPLPTGVAVRDLGGGISRVTLVWDDGAVRNEWLQVRVIANEDTGLTGDDVFYFGNLVGETGDDPAGAAVDTTDLDLTRAAVDLGNPVGPQNAFDFDRSGIVGFADLIRARNAAAAGDALVMLDLSGAVAMGAPDGASSSSEALRTSANEPGDAEPLGRAARDAVFAALGDGGPTGGLPASAWAWLMELDGLDGRRGDRNPGSQTDETDPAVPIWVEFGNE